jgi:glycylpeptide N-tetradecanoyltransferase
LYTLLSNHYVEDDGGNFRFDYSVDFLKWALTPPDHNPDWLVGVRGGKDKKLFGFISGIPVKMTSYGKVSEMAEINFLCVHKKLRSHRLAPVLIKEVTRRVNITNVWQAIYTAGATLPTPFGNANYWHRNLNPRKTVDVGFAYKPADKTIASFIRSHKLPD